MMECYIVFTIIQIATVVWAVDVISKQLRSIAEFLKKNTERKE